MTQTLAGTSMSSERHLNAFPERLLTTADQTVFKHINIGLGHNA